MSTTAKDEGATSHEGGDSIQDASTRLTRNKAKQEGSEKGEDVKEEGDSHDLNPARAGE